jgi:hypothetical protein
MRVILKDRTEIMVSDKEAEAIKDSMLESLEGYVEIGKELIKKTNINGIQSGGVSEKDLPGFNQIEEPRYNCVNNRTSIQVEVHKRILKINGGKTTTALGDKVLREKIRQKIIAEDSDRIWCDNKKGTHACVENKTV